MEKSNPPQPPGEFVTFIPGYGYQDLPPLEPFEQRVFGDDYQDPLPLAPRVGGGIAEYNIEGPSETSEQVLTRFKEKFPKLDVNALPTNKRLMWVKGETLRQWSLFFVDHPAQTIKPLMDFSKRLTAEVLRRNNQKRTRAPRRSPKIPIDVLNLFQTFDDSGSKALSSCHIPPEENAE
jgi:hypothetical protein